MRRQPNFALSEQKRIILEGSRFGGYDYNKLLRELAKIPLNYNSLQIFMSKYSDEFLFISVLGVKFDEINERTCYEPNNFNITSMVFEEAKIKFDAIIQDSSAVSSLNFMEHFLFLLEIYRRIRSRESKEYNSQYNSRWAYYRSFLFEGGSESEKQGLAILLMKLLCSNYKLDQLDEFLKENNMYRLMPAITNGGGRLQKIYTLMANYFKALDEPTIQFQN